MDELVTRYDQLLENLKRNEIRILDAKQISKLVDVLPTEWYEFLINLKKDFRFSNLCLREFISKIKTHNYENEKKKKELIDEIKRDLEKIN